MFYYKDATVEEMKNAHEALGFPLVCDGDAKIVWVDDSIWLGPILGRMSSACSKEVRSE